MISVQITICMIIIAIKCNFYIRSKRYKFTPAIENDMSTHVQCAKISRTIYYRYIIAINRH